MKRVPQRMILRDCIEQVISQLEVMLMYQNYPMVDYRPERMKQMKLYVYCREQPHWVIQRLYVIWESYLNMEYQILNTSHIYLILVQRKLNYITQLEKKLGILELFAYWVNSIKIIRILNPKQQGIVIEEPLNIFKQPKTQGTLRLISIQGNIMILELT